MEHIGTTATGMLVEITAAEELKVAATVPYSGQQVPVRLTVRHLDGRAIVAIGEWPHQKHAEVNPAELIDALTVQEPAHGC